MARMNRKKSLVAVNAVKHPRYDFRASYLQGGVRQTRWFRTKAEAGAFAAEKRVELLNLGRKHGEITEAERQAVIRARGMAEAYAAKGVPDFSLEAALHHYAAHLDARRVSVPTLQAYDAFHAAKEKDSVSVRYLADISGRVQAFAKKHKKLVAEISREDVAAYLGCLKHSAVTKINHHRLISTFLTWCKEEKGWAQINAAEGWKAPRVKAEEPGLLTVPQVRALLDAAAPEIVPALAISLFCGLRAAEVERLDWAAVDFDSACIMLAARNAKTNRRRVIPMPDNLMAWLTPHRQLAGPVRPLLHIWRNRLSDAREAAGIKTWPHNACRHSCASYAYDLEQDPAKVAARLGHGVAVLETHYKGLVKPGQGKAFFAILPAKASNIIPMRRAAV
jgi:integrase